MDKTKLWLCSSFGFLSRYFKEFPFTSPLDSLRNASKKLGEILPQVEQGIAQGMQDLEKKFSKALWVEYPL
ncbi:hypothetical protein GCM10009111_34810 [Colwellia asteriadis]|uniref:Uncharacterized protein n=1 Tax=Colwellia asteriadis TaxID=517723 RepID=A0ABN1LBI0_9GAMM